MRRRWTRWSSRSFPSAAVIRGDRLRARMPVLEATYIVRLIPGWYGNINKRLVRAPKKRAATRKVAARKQVKRAVTSKKPRLR